MNDNQQTATFDLESAYREALAAVGAADLEGDETRDAATTKPKSDGDGGNSHPESPKGEETATRVGPSQIIEAALFVGGVELTGESLASLVKGDFTAESVQRLIEHMNRRYARQRRPYEVRREEGFYRLALRGEFEPVRRRVYGLGPKEVKLSQDALEVLALVAYRQPIPREEVESLRAGQAGNVLRLLVRRGLITVTRTTQTEYTTTDRFLEVFGLANLEELPRAESLEFK